MVSVVLPVYFSILVILGVFSYGYIDPNLTLSSNPVFSKIQEPLNNLAYHQRPVAAILFFILLIGLFTCYGVFLKHTTRIFASWKHTCIVFAASAVILVYSYPALTYDLFNYMLTAKVTYRYHENPYIVMPIEIPNEENLAFTRASNKLALYGPVWLLLSGIPHVLGAGHIWQTIIAFKLMNTIAYIGFSFLIYRMTKNLTQVIFFAANPLVLIEVLMNGHNYIYMMILALAGLVFWQKRKRFFGGIALFLSLWVKGATIVLAPLLLLPKLTPEKIFVYTYWLLSAVFFIVAPLREELYPWYAVWLIMTAALLPVTRHRYVFWFTIVLSFALELRYIPYLWMGYYEGPGPLLRTLLTVVCVGAYILYIGVRYSITKKK